MRHFRAVLIVATIACVAAISAWGGYDPRTGETGPSVARYEYTFDWITGEGHASESHTFQTFYGRIERVDITITSVTANPTVNVSMRDQNGVILIPDAVFTTLADGTNHTFRSESYKASPDADFNPVTHAGNVQVSVDPSADAGGAAQTLTVKVVLYAR